VKTGVTERYGLCGSAFEAACGALQPAMSRGEAKRDVLAAKALGELAKALGVKAKAAMRGAVEAVG
jgi:hypothetical protein